MSIRIIPLAALVLFFFTGCEPAKEMGPPNVVIIFADDLGYGDLGCYGHPTIRTPRLDRMAREGIKLTSFYVGASVCTPSRAALLTGRYPLNVGLPGNLGPDSEGGLSLEERTLAEALSGNGYRTAAFGKWHLGAVPGYLPTDRGFDEYFGILYSNDMMPPWVNTERPLHLYRNDASTDEYPVDQTSLTQRYADEAIRFIEADDERPFFVYLPLAMPHLPIFASEPFNDRSAGGPYGDVIEEIDHNVGRILDVLRERKLEDNTLVIFTSDNGPWRNLPPRMIDSAPVEPWHAGSTGPLSGAKATSMEGGYRVPAIIRWPGRIPADQVSSEVLSTMDLHATILGLTETPNPEAPLDGKDAWASLTEGAPTPHEQFLYFTGRRLDGIRMGDWKLRIAPLADDWRSPELNTGEEAVVLTLHDLGADPYEQFNRAEEHPEIVSRLRAILRKKAEEMGARLAEYPDVE